MKALSLLAFLCVSTAWTQPSTPPAERGDTVIAIFDDGGKLTADEFKGLLQVHPSWQSLPREDAIQEYAFLRKAASVAQNKKLNEQTPYKEEIDFQVMYSMAQIWAQDVASTVTVPPEEVEKYYNDNKEPYRLVKVSGLMIAIGKKPDDDAPALASKPVKKALTEAEAKAKAEKLAADVRAGADFSTLLLKESDDPNSKAKGGALGIWSLSNNDIPGDLRDVVFNLKKEGDVSDPVRQGNEYWLIHADAVTYKPLSEVRDGIFDQLKNEKVKQALHDFKTNSKVTFPPHDQLPPAPPSDPKK